MPTTASFSAESFQLSPDVTVTKRYDPAVKAELWSTAISHNANRIAIDPFDCDAQDCTAIVLTNENHLRAAPSLASRLKIPIFAHPSVAGTFHPISHGSTVADLLSVIEIAGAPTGEIALLDRRDSGTLVMGDALINFGDNGFALLPAKYCRDQRAMRRSLRQLLDLQFERMLFAHGEPLTANARQRLETLLGA